MHVQRVSLIQAPPPYLHEHEEGYTEGCFARWKHVLVAVVRARHGGSGAGNEVGLGSMNHLNMVGSRFCRAPDMYPWPSRAIFASPSANDIVLEWTVGIPAVPTVHVLSEHFFFLSFGKPARPCKATFLVTRVSVRGSQQLSDPCGEFSENVLCGVS